LRSVASPQIRRATAVEKYRDPELARRARAKVGVIATASRPAKPEFRTAPVAGRASFDYPAPSVKPIGRPIESEVSSISSTIAGFSAVLARSSITSGEPLSLL
jgi:hypothetical protein